MNYLVQVRRRRRLIVIGEKEVINQMETDKASDHGSDTESTRGNRVGFSGPLVSNKKSSKRSARFKDKDDSYVEITLDVRDDSFLVQNIKGADQEAALLASQLEKKPTSSLGSQLSYHLRQVSQDPRRITSRRMNKPDRTRSGAARALRGLQFMNKNVGNEGWSEVEKRFDELAVDGMLPKSRFGKCIGLWFARNTSTRKTLLS